MNKLLTVISIAGYRYVMTCFYLMPQDVDAFVLLARERLVADLAGERLLARVQSEVGVERLLLLEGHVADVTNKRVVLQVTVHMVFLLHLVTKPGKFKLGQSNVIQRYNLT